MEEYLMPSRMTHKGRYLGGGIVVLKPGERGTRRIVKELQEQIPEYPVLRIRYRQYEDELGNTRVLKTAEIVLSDLPLNETNQKSRKGKTDDE